MLVLAPAAALVACLFAGLGLPALVTFAAVACLPGVLVHVATPILAPRAASLDQDRATERYARALASKLALPRRRRRAIRIAGGWGVPLASRFVPARIFQDRSDALRLQFERSGLAAAARPSDEGAVLDLAAAWAELTAAGTLELSHPGALACLEAERGRFSPQVLRAAWQLVDEQPPAAREDARAPAPRPLVRGFTRLAAPAR
jgi:hypothetical protein